MAFRFRYQSLLEHRRQVEQQRQRELAICLRRRGELEAMLTKAQDTIRHNKQDLARSLQGRVDTSQLGMFARYATHMTGRGMNVARHIAAAQKQADEARQRLLEATKKVKALELLRDREHERWKKEQAKRETQHLDEVALQAHLRRAREEVRS